MNTNETAKLRYQIRRDMNKVKKTIKSTSDSLFKLKDVDVGLAQELISLSAKLLNLQANLNSTF
jgi:hypothetical protein